MSRTGVQRNPLQAATQGAPQAAAALNQVAAASTRMGSSFGGASAQSKLLGKSLIELERARTRAETRLGNIRVGAGGFGFAPAEERKALEGLLEINRAAEAMGGKSRLVNEFNQQLAQLPPIAQRASAGMSTLSEKIAFQRDAESRLIRGLSPRQLLGGFNEALAGVRAGQQGAGEQAQFFADRINKLTPAFDGATESFGRHARRIAEGIILYDAFGKAAQGVADTVRNIADVARERIRFEQVVGTGPTGLGPERQGQFVSELGRVAAETNTQMGDLSSVLDTVAGSMNAASGSSDKFANSMEFLRDVGKFTNITQRGVATETDNLLGLLNLSGDSLDEFHNRLGRITVAGKNSSSVIAEITDTLNEAGRSAADAGFDFDILTAIAGRIVPKFKGAISGRELGAGINTFIQKMRDPTIVEKIEEISGGLIRVRDAATGALRPASDVFIDIAKAQERLSPETFERVVDSIVPPLNPAARATITTILKELLPALREAGPQFAGTADDFDKLNNALVSGPAEQVSRALIALQAAATAAFSDDVVAAASALAFAIGRIGDVLALAGTPIGGFVIDLAALAAGLKLVTFLLRTAGAFFFSGQIRAAQMAVAIAQAGAASGTAAGEVGAVGGAAGAAAGGVTVFGTSLVGLRGALISLTASFAPLLAVMALMMAMDFANQVNENTRALNAQIAGLAQLGETTNIDQLIANLEAARSHGSKAAGGFSLFGDVAKGLFIDPAIQGNIDNLKAIKANMDLVGGSSDALKTKLASLKQQVADTSLFRIGGPGPDEVNAIKDQISVLEAVLAKVGDTSRIVTFDDFNQGLLGATQSSSEAASEEDRLREIIEAINQPLTDAGQGFRDLADAEERAAAATAINNQLSGTRAALLNDLVDKLERGAISLDDFNAASERIGKASDIASRFVTVLGDQLSLVPGLQERIARTGEDAATALTKILTSGDTTTIDNRLDIINQMIEIAEANADAAKAVEAQPITPRVETGTLLASSGKAAGIMAAMTQNNLDTARFLQENKPRPELDLSALRAQLREALAALQALKAATGAAGGGGPFSSILGPAFGNVDIGLRTGIQDKIDALRTAIRKMENSTTGAIKNSSIEELKALARDYQVQLGIREGDKRLEDATRAAASRPQTALIDVGDLNARQVARAVAIARRLQSAIPGARSEAADETVALVRDARFLQFIRGLDNRFLAEAIQALTDVEKRRLELEQQRLQDVTRSIVTRVGPIQSLVSAPVLAAGGGLLSGQGLNADPRLGNITINVPINWSGMSLKDLQNFIYKAISQAWVDAGRGG